MLLASINNRLANLQKSLREQGDLKAGLVKTLRPHAVWDATGTMVGVKVGTDLRDHLEKIQKAYGFSTHRETVLMCILIGSEVLMERLLKEPR